MKRRAALRLIGAASLMGLHQLCAQSAPKRTIGFLHSGSANENASRVAAFLKGLREAGFVDGQNIGIEYRWADGHSERLPELAADLVRLNVAAIATPASAAATFAARQASATIPIVFATGADPVALGLVDSLSRPGGNVTGVNTLNVDVTAKRFALMRDLAPNTKRHFALLNPTSPLAASIAGELTAVASSLGIALTMLNASSEREIDAAFVEVGPGAGNSLLVSSDAYFYIRKAQLVALAARHALPVSYDSADYVALGGLLSYGADWLDMMRQAGFYVGRILRGEPPASLPVIQSTKCELVINLKTARGLNLQVPSTLLAVADQVIE